MKLQKFTVKYYAKYLDKSGYSLERFIDIIKARDILDADARHLEYFIESHDFAQRILYSIEPYRAGDEDIDLREDF